jgi:uncharacterized cupin superfamily protein
METMSTPTSHSTAEHYAWGTGCDGWHLLRTIGCSVIEERMPPGTREVRHWHARACQFFYVLAGTLTLELDGQRHLLGPRVGLEVARGVAHQALNETAEDVEFLVISTPPAQDDRINAEPIALTPVPQGRSAAAPKP